jgi:dihydropyrimidine dehydrogenase (NAD+) subunit PreT
MNCCRRLKVSKTINAVENDASTRLTHRTAMEEAARCLLCHDAPCSIGCPAGTDPAKFIRSIRFRNPKGAAETIRENNVLGGVCAIVCPYDRLCQEACGRSGIDRPIEIGKLQRYAIEQEKDFNMKPLISSDERKPEKIACIGAGPASLAAAAQLSVAGYQVTVFEKEEKAGGTLTYGIAFSRLPQEIIDYDIEHIKRLGVEFRFNKTIDNLDELYKLGFNAVFIGTGLRGSVLPEIPGNELSGVFTAVDFLKKARIERENFTFGDKVVVIGGGDVAVDCAVSAKLLGASDVRIVYRRTIEEAPAEMNEFQYALSLGIGIITNMSPVELKGGTSLESVAFDGRDQKSGLKLAADAVVFATGQKAECINDKNLKLTEKGYIEVDGNFNTGIPGVFAAGDIANSGGTVVEAVRDGKNAATSIINWLEEKGAV